MDLSSALYDVVPPLANGAIHFNLQLTMLSHRKEWMKIVKPWLEGCTVRSNKLTHRPLNKLFVQLLLLACDSLYIDPPYQYVFGCLSKKISNKYLKIDGDFGDGVDCVWSQGEHGGAIYIWNTDLVAANETFKNRHIQVIGTVHFTARVRLVTCETIKRIINIVNYTYTIWIRSLTGTWLSEPQILVFLSTSYSMSMIFKICISFFK